MNPKVIDGELVDCEPLPSGHCVVKLMVRDHREVRVGECLRVTPYLTEQAEDENEKWQL